MIRLNLAWWFGLAWFGAWVALPLVALPTLGAVAGGLAWALLAPWTALAGMAAVHRLLPDGGSGTFAMFADRGSVCWALKGWAPSLYLTTFQPIWFQSEIFQRIALCAFGARLGRGALLTSRTIVREPHRLQVGAGSLVGEFVHLASAYQPRPKVLVVGDIHIGARTLIGAYSHLGPGTHVGNDSILEHAVVLGPHSRVGSRTRIGAGTTIYSGVEIGDGVHLGKECLVFSGSVIPDGAHLQDGTVLDSGRAAC